VGVSQAIGTGSRDLSEAVGGLMMLAGLQALQDDPDTSVIVLISKPPAAAVTEKVLGTIGGASRGSALCLPSGTPLPAPGGGRRVGCKPTVVCFLAAEPGSIEAAGAIPATDLTQTAAIAAALAHEEDPRAALAQLKADSQALIPLAAAEQARLAPGQRALRGLFAGGTFCYEAQLILRSLPEPVYSNAPLVKTHKMADSHVSAGHVCLDLGRDEFTQGRLHPMLDPTLRNRRIVQEARDPQTAVILLDVVLGYGAHPDPADATVEAIRQAQRIAADAGRHLVFVASVCGTEADPQPLGRQEAILHAAGVLVLPDNASAARLAGLITQALPAQKPLWVKVV
jgi:hypothetical protein